MLKYYLLSKSTPIHAVVLSFRLERANGVQRSQLKSSESYTSSDEESTKVETTENIQPTQQVDIVLIRNNDLYQGRNLKLLQRSSIPVAPARLPYMTNEHAPCLLSNHPVAMQKTRQKGDSSFTFCKGVTTRQCSSSSPVLSPLNGVAGFTSFL